MLNVSVIYGNDTLFGIIKGIIIPGHILLSDKTSRGNVTKNTKELCPRGALLQRVLFREYKLIISNNTVYSQFTENINIILKQK